MTTPIGRTIQPDDKRVDEVMRTLGFERLQAWRHVNQREQILQAMRRSGR